MIILLVEPSTGADSFFNWDSFSARLNSHYKAQSYKKKKKEKDE